MRPIDADALKDRFENLAYDDWNQGAETTLANAFREAADVVEDMPTIDAEPERKKGKWVAIGNTGLAACKCGFFTDRYRAYNFCPNCGDEMEKGEGDG